MLIRLLVAIGVPRKVVDRYVQRSANPNHLRHNFVRGVADPTSNRAMEPNTIFISGKNLKYVVEVNCSLSMSSFVRRASKPTYIFSH